MNSTIHCWGYCNYRGLKLVSPPMKSVVIIKLLDRKTINAHDKWLHHPSNDFRRNIAPYHVGRTLFCQYIVHLSTGFRQQNTYDFLKFVNIEECSITSIRNSNEWIEWNTCTHVELYTHYTDLWRPLCLFFLPRFDRHIEIMWLAKLIGAKTQSKTHNCLQIFNTIHIEDRTLHSQVRWRLLRT